MGTHIKLGPKAASFLDKDHGIKLLPGQSTPLPNPVPPKVREWLMQGGLVQFTEAEEEPEVFKVEIAVDLDTKTIKELEAYSLEKFGEVPEFDKKADLIEKIKELEASQD